MSVANPYVISVNSVEKTLPKINQDKYTSEYLLKESTGELRMTIRHSKENVQPDGTQFDRHNVELKQTIYGVDGDPDEIIIAYLVLRASAKTTNTDLGYIAVALAAEIDSTTVGQLHGWQS